MACETIEAEINGVQYVTTQWSATKQLLNKMKLISVFGNAIFQVVQGLQGTKGDEEVGDKQMGAIENAFTTLFEKSSPEQITETIKSILTCGATKRDGKRITPGTFDEIYNDAGMGEMYRACLFVIKANYGDFLKGQKVASILAKAEGSL